MKVRKTIINSVKFGEDIEKKEKLDSVKKALSSLRVPALGFIDDYLA